MTTPAPDPNIFGPGTLKIGETGSEIDASCMVNSLKITASPNRGDSKTMLCGTVKAGNTVYDYTMDGTLDLDLEDGAASLFALSQDNPASEQKFVFTPNTGGVTSAAGTLILDPLDFGGDEYGAVMVGGKPRATMEPDYGGLRRNRPNVCPGLGRLRPRLLA